MFYRCKDCGGNAVYDPKKKKMVCESCGNEETQEKIPQEKLHICNNCGAEIESKKTDYLRIIQTILWMKRMIL